LGKAGEVLPEEVRSVLPAVGATIGSIVYPVAGTALGYGVGAHMAGANSTQALTGAGASAVTSYLGGQLASMGNATPPNNGIEIYPDYGGSVDPTYNAATDFFPNTDYVSAPTNSADTLQDLISSVDTSGGGTNITTDPIPTPEIPVEQVAPDIAPSPEFSTTELPDMMPDASTIATAKKAAGTVYKAAGTAMKAKDVLDLIKALSNKQSQQIVNPTISKSAVNPVSSASNVPVGSMATLGNMSGNEKNPYWGKVLV